MSCIDGLAAVGAKRKDKYLLQCDERVRVGAVATLQTLKENSGQFDVAVLADEVIKLLRMSLDNLYTTLGGQLLGTAPPSTVAGIVSYLAAARSATEAKVLHDTLPPFVSVRDWGEGLGIICDELKRDGMRYLAERTQELRQALNNEDILHLAEEVSPSHIQVILMVVAAVLRLPRALDTISVTITAVLLKQGLRNLIK